MISNMSSVSSSMDGIDKTTCSWGSAPWHPWSGVPSNSHGELCSSLWLSKAGDFLSQSCQSTTNHVALPASPMETQLPMTQELAQSYPGRPLRSIDPARHSIGHLDMLALTSPCVTFQFQARSKHPATGRTMSPLFPPTHSCRLLFQLRITPRWTVFS